MYRMAVALVSAALLATACASTRTEPQTANPDSAERKSFIEGRWETLRNQYGVDDIEWSGHELLLYGRERDAITPSIRVFDPTTHAIRTIAVPGPDRRGASTIWTGHELLIIGGRSTNADLPLRNLAYEPTTSSWRELAPSQLPVRVDAPIAWTGREAIVVSGFDARPGQGYETPAAGAGAYDPATDSWRTIAEPPDLTAGSGLINQSIWTGSEVVVWGKSRAAVGARWVAYNPITDTWCDLARPPVMAGGDQLAWAVHSNGKLIALGYLGHAASLDLATARWQELPAFLDHTYLIVPQLITIGDEVIGVLGQLRALTADRSAWQLGPHAPTVGYDFGTVTRLVWTGRELYAIDVGGGFARYIPADRL